MTARPFWFTFSLLILLLAFTSSEVFVEEFGETETISIDEPTRDEKFVDIDVPERRSDDDAVAGRVKRASSDYSSEAYEDEEEENAAPGSGSEPTYEDEEDDQYYDEGGEKEGGAGPGPEQSPSPIPPETTPIIPTRVVPTLLSPSFDDAVTDGGDKPTLSISVKPIEADDDIVQPTAVFSEPPKVFNSAVYPEIEEGSGNEDYNEVSSIVATRVVDSVPDRTKVPEFSQIYPSYFDPNREAGTVTEKMPNQPPYVQTKLKKYHVVAGKSFRLKIPEETFGDLEDGGTRNLKLRLRHENGSIVRNSWIGFDEDNQIVYALPVDENGIGRYAFRLEAYDKEGQSISDTLDISVRQYSGSRLVSHQFSIEFAFADPADTSATNNWPWKFIEKIGELYGDSKLSNIIVREVSSNPFVFGWTNDTLTQPNCPKDAIRSLFSKLIDDHGKNSKAMSGAPSRRLKSLLAPNMIAKSVTLTYHGTCLHDTSLSPFDPAVVGKDAAVPVIRNPIDRINVTAGELLRFKVPEDTCWDEEDGSTPKLNLHLLTTNRRELSPSAWLQFDSKNQEFVGIPLEEEVGREEYQLVCSDRNGLSAIDGIVVIVQNRPFSERFGIEFGLEFKDFSGQRRDTKVKIVESIASYFGDPTPSNVILKTFDVEEAKVVWYNKSLAYVACDNPNIKWVTNQMLLPDGKVRPRFVQHFEQYLQLVDVNAVKKGSCALDVPLVPTSGGPRNEDGDGTSGNDTIFHGIIPSADYLLTFIIPAVIITCMLVLAILLACLLHKKRKAGKLNLFYSESLPPRVPVILQDELFEDQEQGFHKQPILLPEDSRPPGGSGHYNPHHPQEMDRLLQQQQVNIDFRAGSLSRPTPAYQRRQL